MATSITELYQDVLGMSDEEKINFGRRASIDVLGYLSDTFDNPGGIYHILIGAYLGINAKINPAQYEYCRAVFGMENDYESFVKIVYLSYKSSIVKSLEKVIEKASEKVKTSFVMLGVILCSFDRSIVVDNHHMLAKFID